MEMSSHHTAAQLPPHVLIFPVPMQGHINSMLKLAELLCLPDIHVTIIFSEYIDTRLRRHTHIHSRFSRYPGFRVATITDGLPDHHPRAGDCSMDVVMSLLQIGGAEFRKLMETTDALSCGGARRRVTCLIMDGVVSFAAPVARELGIPFLYFRTISACAFWAYFSFPDVIAAGDVPLKDKDEDKYAYWKRAELDVMVRSVPGMEGFLRRRDLPSFCRVTDVNDPQFQAVTKETRLTTQATGLILNSFEELEGPILDQIRNQIPNLYSIGPLQTHLETRLQSANDEGSSLTGSSLWEEDSSSMRWLDPQPPKSVVYVSFGSLTTLTRNEMMEFWYGLVNSGHKFLWVMRPDSIVGDNGVPAELEEGTAERGRIVGWVAQNEVLGHASIGAFLTHSGWNSTLEAIAAGVPMLCWPYFADQTTNSRFVSEVWKVGLDMKDSCDRVIVEKMVREIMKEELWERSAGRMADLARQAVSEGGTSATNFSRLVDFIKSSA